MTRLPDSYFEQMYAERSDPWELASRWYETRKYAITMSLLPKPRYRHALEPGCSIGTLTQLLAQRCDRVTSLDVSEVALREARCRLADVGAGESVSLIHGSLDDPWPTGPFDLLVLSEVAYYLSAELLADVLRTQCPSLAPGATVVAAHWRHPVVDYPLSGDEANAVIASTPGLVSMGCYRDADVVIEVFDTDGGGSVAARDGVPGAR